MAGVLQKVRIKLVAKILAKRWRIEMKKIAERNVEVVVGVSKCNIEMRGYL